MGLSLVEWLHSQGIKWAEYWCQIQVPWAMKGQR